ncbi:TetR/AcrR family transcriptional regulator [Tsukamurella sp. 8F]|uniref:TetR/AcrR family transcriptional regulator n=1 Tax=unclassified Tsukamurella TaxID=2633480 RepID=UPI0023B9E7FE|nr:MULTISPECIES: TetR/AcrR family transcriptional regulator [unclassified Tsukamurella]MDF0531772.1 TetR/AcrR family transcriptional regulator [Tsukamurella sp. 8J]MDF0588026.1 TetR/AcrR family transcriptional regulator [Tsukamurella sp. 8F]
MEVNRRTQAERTAATKAALKAAARALFAEHGYAGVGTQAIVDAAGVTRGALYHQFGDKRGLFIEVFDDIEREAIGHAAGVIGAADPEDPLRAMEIGFDAILDALTEPGITRISLVDAPAVLGWEEWRARGEQYGMAVIEALLARAVEVGAMQPQPLRPIAHVVLGAIDESALYVSRAEDRNAARSEVRAVARRIIRSFGLPLD